MYHALWRGSEDAAAVAAAWATDPQLGDPGARRYALDHRVFERQMLAVAQAGRRTPAAWEELDAPPLPGALWMTFDDGHRSNHELALPILRRHGLRAIFFITTDRIGAEGFMTEDQLRELRRAGMLLGTHGCSHVSFADFSEHQLLREVTQSKSKLEAVLGEPVLALALPGGRTHPALRELARRAGYRHVFTSRIAWADAGGDPLDWPRIPMTRQLGPDFLQRLLSGDDSEVRAMARWERRRAWARRLLGNALYDRLRGIALKRC